VTNLVIRPTIKFIRFGYILVLVLAAATAAATVWVPEIPLWAAGVIAVFLLWPAARHLRRQLTKMTLTGDKLRYESGFASKTTRTIQLPKVQDVRVDQRLGQRLFGVGDLSIETAGETSRLTVPNIDRPQEVAEQIIEAAQAPEGRHYAAGGGEGEAGTPR